MYSKQLQHDINYCCLHLLSVIRLSSPYLNVLVAVGAIILYIDIIITILPTTEILTQTVLCNVSAVLPSFCIKGIIQRSPTPSACSNKGCYSKSTFYRAGASSFEVVRPLGGGIR